MTTRQRFMLMGMVSFWSAVAFAFLWLVISLVTDAPRSYTVEFFGSSWSINRWWDVLLVPLTISLAMAVNFWIVPSLYKFADSLINNIFDLKSLSVTTVMAGILLFIGAVLVACSTVLMGIALPVALFFGLFAGVGAGLVMSSGAMLLAATVSLIVYLGLRIAIWNLAFWQKWCEHEKEKLRAF